MSEAPLYHDVSDAPADGRAFWLKAADGVRIRVGLWRHDGARGTVFLLQEHLDRFYSGANALDIRIPMEKQALGALLTELLARVEGSCQFVYWQVTRGTALREHTYESGMQGKLWVMITPAALPDPEQPIRLITREDTRFYHCNLKTLNLLPSVMAAQAA